VLLRAMVPFGPDVLPDLSAVRVWIGGGKQDVIIPPGETKRLAHLLQEAGADVTAHFVDAGHGLTNGELVLVKRWLDR
jgi:phospholipase/carboxylesterase